MTLGAENEREVAVGEVMVNGAHQTSRTAPRSQIEQEIWALKEGMQKEDHCLAEWKQS